jgi:hypothetical protein
MRSEGRFRAKFSGNMKGVPDVEREAHPTVLPGEARPSRVGGYADWRPVETFVSPFDRLFE